MSLSPVIQRHTRTLDDLVSRGLAAPSFSSEAIAALQDQFNAVFIEVQALSASPGARIDEERVSTLKSRVSMMRSSIFPFRHEDMRSAYARGTSSSSSSSSTASEAKLPTRAELEKQASETEELRIRKEHDHYLASLPSRDHGLLNTLNKARIDAWNDWGLKINDEYYAASAKSSYETQKKGYYKFLAQVTPKSSSSYGSASVSESERASAKKEQARERKAYDAGNELYNQLILSERLSSSDESRLDDLLGYREKAWKSWMRALSTKGPFDWAKAQKDYQETNASFLDYATSLKSKYSTRKSKYPTSSPDYLALVKAGVVGELRTAFEGQEIECEADFKRAYKAYAIKNHPDKNPTADSAEFARIMGLADEMKSKMAWY